MDQHFEKCQYIEIMRILLSPWLDTVVLCSSIVAFSGCSFTSRRSRICSPVGGALVPIFEVFNFEPKNFSAFTA